MMNRLTEECHAANYERYKERCDKIEQEQRRLFWHINGEYNLDMSYYDDIDYAYEINQLEWLWYEKYLRDIWERWLFDDIPDDDDDRR